VSKQFGCKSVDDNGGGLNVYSVVQVGSGGTSGVITDDSEIFFEYNLPKNSITQIYPFSRSSKFRSTHTHTHKETATVQ
jgi:hypothetical protein